MLADILKNPSLTATFDSWGSGRQEQFLGFCTGIRGVKILYDQFFKELFNPSTVPERLELLLSLILGCKVQILNVLPNESSRIAAEDSLLVMDIVVELADGSIANIEVQRIGYAFPGQRCACYMSDLLLRQYKRVKGEQGKTFSYRDIKKVYVIVFMEKSTQAFHRLPKEFIHRGKFSFSTGLNLDIPQEAIFFPLDIFLKNLQNIDISSYYTLEVWLTFLSCDNPADILRLVDACPEFEPLYQEVYRMCQDTEKMMSIFSEELAIMDKNTVQYMVDEMQDTIDTLKDNNAALQNDNNILKNTNSALQNEILMLKEKLNQYEKSSCKNNPT